MNSEDWKPISELPARATNFAVYDPTMCPGYRIINGCKVLARGSDPKKNFGSIVDPNGDDIPDATHFRAGLLEPKV